MREQVEEMIATINRRDFEAMAELSIIDPEEAEFVSALSPAEGRRSYIGIAGMREWAEDVDSVWADFRIEVEDVREIDDGRVLVLYRVTGMARTSGVPLNTRTGQVWTFRNGKLWRNESYSDPSEALEAAGLSE
jgi:ketosteroid isomerase-like protein